MEGLIDVYIMERLYRSMDIGAPVELDEVPRKAKPTKALELKRPAFSEQELFHAVSPAA